MYYPLIQVCFIYRHQGEKNDKILTPTRTGIFVVDRIQLGILRDVNQSMMLVSSVYLFCDQSYFVIFLIIDMNLLSKYFIYLHDQCFRLAEGTMV